MKQDSYSPLPRFGFIAVGSMLGAILISCAVPTYAGLSKEVSGNSLNATSAAEEAQMAPSQRSPKDYDANLAMYKGALRRAQQIGDRKTEADCLFYLGLTRQQQAEATGWSLEAAPFIAESEQYYKQALAIRPDSAATLNNLGQLYLRTGRTEEAEEYLKKAATLADPRQAFYAKNYGDLRAHQGDWKSAQKYYALAAKAQPENSDAHEKLVRAYLESDPKELGNYLWGLVLSGQILSAQESAITVLGRGGLDASTREELFTITVVSLSKQTYDPAKFRESATASSLAKLVEDPALGPGVTQLLMLHGRENFDPSRYSWWGDRGQPNRDPPRGVWPRDGFRQLIRSLGRWYQRGKNDELAEQYYLLAVKLDRQEIDPEACLALAELYVAQERLGALRELMKRYAPSLFYGKGQAYRESQMEKIYTYHRTLGVIYSYLDQWGNSNEPASAIFQLERAQETARQLGRNSEPRVVNFLATGYEKTNQVQRGVELRLSTAERLVQIGDKAGAREVLKPLEGQCQAAVLSQADKQRCERIQIQVLQERPDRPI